MEAKTEVKELEFKPGGNSINRKTGEGDPLWDNDLLWITGWKNLVDHPSPEGKIYYASSREGLFSLHYNYADHHSLGVEGMWLYDHGTAGYHFRMFRSDDIEKMNLCGIIFAERLREDGGLFKFVGQKCRQSKDRLTLDQIKAFSPTDRKQSLDAAFNFYQKFYAAPRYENEQDLLWLDMKKDHDNRFAPFFKECSDLYIQLFLRRVAHKLGIHFGNCSGD